MPALLTGMITLFLYLHLSVYMDKCVVNLQVVSCLMALWTCLPAATAQDCSNCTGCGTTTVICDNLGLTSFPQLPVAVQQMVEIL